MYTNPNPPPRDPGSAPGNPSGNPSDDLRYHTTMRWLSALHNTLNALKWIGILIALFSLTTCVHSCRIDETIREMRVY